MKLDFTNKEHLFAKVNAIPGGAAWKCKAWDEIGDLLDAQGNPLTERVELYMRDAVDCIEELMGNPIFKDLLRYAPERWYEDEQGRKRLYGDMWTGEWWWRLQVRLVVRLQTTRLTRPRNL